MASTWAGWQEETSTREALGNGSTVAKVSVSAKGVPIQFAYRGRRYSSSLEGLRVRFEPFVANYTRSQSVAEEGIGHEDSRFLLPGREPCQLGVEGI